jgi:uncharacterized membrane protein YfcA
MGIMAVVILLAAIRMLYSKQIKGRNECASQPKRIIGSGLIGFVIGFMAGLLGIGGGVFVVPLLIYFLGIDTKIAAATSMFVVCFSSFAGFATHVSIGAIDWKFVLPAAIFSFAGGQIGSRIMSEKLKGRTIRIIFGVVLLLFSAKLIQRAFI